MSRAVHPSADRWPLLPEDELEALAADIQANGLVHPIVVDGTGQIIDGRNRFYACQMAEVEPTFRVHDGDPYDFILSGNSHRRHQSTGQLAMLRCMTLIDAGRRENGRWKRNSVAAIANSGNSNWSSRLAEAGFIYDHAPDLVDRVINGSVAISVAYVAAKEREAGGEPTRTERRRRPLPKVAGDLGTKISKNADALERLLDDDRLTSNSEEVRRAIAAHIDRLVALIDRFNNEVINA